MKFRLFIIKRIVEDCLMLPLILMGRTIAYFIPMKKEYKVFYFFPFYHTGGAEKVHALVAKATGGADCVIFFAKKSHNKGMLHLFEETGCVIKDVSNYTDNKWLYFINIIFRGIISGYINHQKIGPVIFNGQCNFGYKLSPWIGKEIRQLELIHSVSNFSYIRIPFLPFINTTVMISQVKISEHLTIYRRFHIPQAMDSRIKFIMNAIELPQPQPLPKMLKDSFTVLYVGRSTPEKRVQLIAEVAYLIKQQEAAVQFQFLGEVEEAVPEKYKAYCTFLGNQNDEALINETYASADVLILLSDTEGFPMVVMEAMARGLAIVATAVGELPLHIKNGDSGFIISDYLHEKHVVEAAVSAVMQLFHDRNLLNRISSHNINYAYQHFGMERFNKEYKALFNEGLS